MDRRYSQARGAGGVRASRGRTERSDALTRARMARARIDARSARAAGRGGAQSISTGADVAVSRAVSRAEGSQIFQDSGSGAYGYQGWKRPRSTGLEDPRAGLLD
jgi:hypothetical protein